MMVTMVKTIGPELRRQHLTHIAICAIVKEAIRNRNIKKECGQSPRKGAFHVKYRLGVLLVAVILAVSITGVAQSPASCPMPPVQKKHLKANMPTTVVAATPEVRYVVKEVLIYRSRSSEIWEGLKRNGNDILAAIIMALMTLAIVSGLTWGNFRECVETTWLRHVVDVSLVVVAWPVLSFLFFLSL